MLRPFNLVCCCCCCCCCFCCWLLCWWPGNMSRPTAVINENNTFNFQFIGMEIIFSLRSVFLYKVNAVWKLIFCLFSVWVRLRWATRNSSIDRRFETERVYSQSDVRRRDQVSCVLFYNCLQNRLSVWLCHSSGTEDLTFWRRIFFSNFSTPVFKMWIIQKPNKVALWNKRHFEEKKWRLHSMLKIFSTDICWIIIKWGI